MDTGGQGAVVRRPYASTAGQQQGGETVSGSSEHSVLASGESVSRADVVPRATAVVKPHTDPQAERWDASGSRASGCDGREDAMEKHTYAALSAYMDLLLDAVCVVDKVGHYVGLRGGFERMLRYSPEEMIGKPMIQLVHPDDRELTLRTAREIMSGRHQHHFEIRYLRKDGQVVHVMWSARWSEAHQLRIAVARDITRRKHAESVQAAVYAISEAAHTNDDLHTLFERIHRRSEERRVGR